MRRCSSSEKLTLTEKTMRDATHAVMRNINLVLITEERFSMTSLSSLGLRNWDNLIVETMIEEQQHSG